MKELRLIERCDLDNTTEDDETPYKVEDYLQHNRYHHSMKGCECEMRIRRRDNHNIAINKFCITHNILCSKTGWELGWYLGRKSEKPVPEFNRFLTDEIVRQIKLSFNAGIRTLELCKKFGLSYYTIYGITSNSRYKDVV